MLGGWAVGQGLSQAAVTAIELSVAAQVTLVLPNQTKVFVKAWPGTTNVRALEAQMDVQLKMGERGFPAPAVLTKPSALGPGRAVAMAYSRAGVATDARRSGVRQMMAAGLARFVTEAEHFRNLDGLPRRSLPAEGVIWPPPHNALFDVEATERGAEWIDDVASRALAVMRPAAAASSAIATGAPRICGWTKVESPLSTIGMPCSWIARHSFSVPQRQTSPQLGTGRAGNAPCS